MTQEQINYQEIIEEQAEEDTRPQPEEVDEIFMGVEKQDLRDVTEAVEDDIMGDDILPEEDDYSDIFESSDKPQAPPKPKYRAVKRQLPRIYLPPPSMGSMR